MGIFPSTDQAMIEHDKLDHVGRWLITFGQLFTQIGTRIVQSRNELLTERFQEQERRIEAAYDGVHEAYQAGRADERNGVPDPDDILDVDQADEHQADEEPDEFQEHARL